MLAMNINSYLVLTYDVQTAFITTFESQQRLDGFIFRYYRNT